MEYYLYKNDQNIGPLPESEVVGGLRNGRFLPNDLGCRVGDNDWKDLSFFFPLETPSPFEPRQIAQATPSVYQEPASSPRVVHQPMVVYQPAPAANTNSDVSRMLMYQANQKSTGTAYLLWFFLGGLSAHRFYLNRPGTAILQLSLWWISLVLCWVLIGFLIVWIPILWILIDAALIPQWVREHNNNLAMGINGI